jgi:hypothetical protein
LNDDEAGLRLLPGTAAGGCAQLRTGRRKVRQCTRDLTPEQTGAFLRSEEQLWWPIVRHVEAEDQKPSR